MLRISGSFWNILNDFMAREKLGASIDPTAARSLNFEFFSTKLLNRTSLFNHHDSTNSLLYSKSVLSPILGPYGGFACQNLATLELPALFLTNKMSYCMTHTLYESYHVIDIIYINLYELWLKYYLKKKMFWRLFLTDFNNWMRSCRHCLGNRERERILNRPNRQLNLGIKNLNPDRIMIIHFPSSFRIFSFCNFVYQYKAEMSRHVR